MLCENSHSQLQYLASAYCLSVYQFGCSTPCNTSKLIPAQFHLQDLFSSYFFSKKRPSAGVHITTGCTAGGLDPLSATNLCYVFFFIYSTIKVLYSSAEYSVLLFIASLFQNSFLAFCIIHF